MEGRHDGEEHLRANILVELNKLFQVHERFFLKHTLQKLVDVFLVLVALLTVQVFTFRIPVETFLGC